MEAVELALRLTRRLRGVGVYRDPWKHFGEGGVEDAERRCEPANRDLLAYFRFDGPVTFDNVEREPLSDRRRQAVVAERVSFDSPLPSGIPENDRVRAILLTPRNPGPRDRVVVFHHPVYQDSWRPWEWFVADLAERVPVALMAAPYHFERTPAGWFPGEGLINANPAMVYEAIRQWFADHLALHRVLDERFGLRPAAVVGYSLGAFQALMAASAGQLALPIVSIGSTNRYAYGLLHGPLGGPVVEAMRRVGIDEPRLCRMVDSLQLERYVTRLDGHPVLFVTGDYDRADPPPSLERLERALRPTRSLHLPAGHGTLLFFRRRIFREALRFFREHGVLP